MSLDEYIKGKNDEIAALKIEIKALHEKLCLKGVCSCDDGRFPSLVTFLGKPLDYWYKLEIDHGPRPD